MTTLWVGAQWGIVSLYRPKPLSDTVAEALKEQVRPQRFGQARAPAREQSLSQVFTAIAWSRSGEKNDVRNLALESLVKPVFAADGADSFDFMEVLAAHRALLRRAESPDDAVADTVTGMNAQPNAALREQLRNQLLRQYPDVQQAIETALAERGYPVIYQGYQEP
jgi:hypothetical protein